MYRKYDSVVVVSIKILIPPRVNEVAFVHSHTHTHIIRMYNKHIDKRTVENISDQWGAADFNCFFLFYLFPDGGVCVCACVGVLCAKSNSNTAYYRAAPHRRQTVSCLPTHTQLPSPPHTYADLYFLSVFRFLSAAPARHRRHL